MAGRWSSMTTTFSVSDAWKCGKKGGASRARIAQHYHEAIGNSSSIFLT